MPEDTKYIVNQSQLTAIGTAIREKLNEQTTYTVDEMPGKIEDISGGGGGGTLLNKKLTITATNITPDEDMPFVSFWDIFIGFMVIDDYILTMNDVMPIPSGTSQTIILYMPVYYPPNAIMQAVDLEKVSCSDMINCSINESGELYITDSTLDASITIVNTMAGE